MGRETPGGIEAMRWMEEVLKRRNAPAQDPGLRKTFARLAARTYPHYLLRFG